MLAELKAIEPQLKQVLYGCVEHVQATKAALYLPTSFDTTEKTFEIVTSYQFNDPQRRHVTASDDLPDRLLMKRAPFFINGLTSEPRFSEMLFRQGTDRVLAAPLFARGRLIGFIDMRDKAGKRPFESQDLTAAKRIADDMLAILMEKNLFGLELVKLAESDGIETERLVVSRSATPPPSAPPVMPAVLQTPSRPHEISPAALQAITTARQIMSRRQIRAEPPRRVLTEYDLEVVRLLLPAALAIPGAVLASFTVFSETTDAPARQAIVGIASLSDDAMEMLERHLQSWLRRANKPMGGIQPQVSYPFGVQVVPITAAAISTILSAPVNAHSAEGLTLTVGFERTPEGQAQRALQIFLRQIEQSVESAIAATADRNDRQTVAEKLLEPDFTKYPDLVEHSREVAGLSQQFAAALDLPATEVETIRLAALVHDVGLRLLDYERLYRRPNLTAEEMRALAEHPVIGAALVEPLLGSEVADAVLRHHERVDGKGYPSRMSGMQIPPAARIIQIVDAFIAMTSPSSYQPPLPVEEAAARLREGAGSQFDEALTLRFLHLLPQFRGQALRT